MREVSLRSHSMVRVILQCPCPQPSVKPHSYFLRPTVARCTKWATPLRLVVTLRIIPGRVSLCQGQGHQAATPSHWECLLLILLALTIWRKFIEMPTSEILYNRNVKLHERWLWCNRVTSIGLGKCGLDQAEAMGGIYTYVPGLPRWYQW